MPTYEYACAACDSRQEVQQKMTDASLTVCPSCGAPGLRKLFTNVGVVFKGTGFYRNDSREPSKSNGSSESSAPAKSGASADSSTGTPTTSEPATAAKATSAPATPAKSSTPATTGS